jgi:hypothetical protein
VFHKDTLLANRKNQQEPRAARKGSPKPRYKPNQGKPDVSQLPALARAGFNGADPVGQRVNPFLFHQEQFVLVELSGIIDSDFLSKCKNKCKILGIDTERPILQGDSYVFAGEYEDTYFEENAGHVDAEGSDKTLLKYTRHTMRLSVRRTLLTEKKGENTEKKGKYSRMAANEGERLFL